MTRSNQCSFYAATYTNRL